MEKIIYIHKNHGERHNTDIFLVNEVRDMKITRQIDKKAKSSCLLLHLLEICMYTISSMNLMRSLQTIRNMKLIVGSRGSVS